MKEVSAPLFPDWPIPEPAPRARKELTFKHNARLGRHGWLRLTPAYSVRLVSDILDELATKPRLVLDPFCGTGTTPLCAAEKGIAAAACEINPFLIWLATAKFASYTERDLERASELAERIAEAVTNPPETVPPPPNIHNIERWWHPDVTRSLCVIRSKLDDIRNKAVGDLLRVAFCRTVIGESNAAFNHQSMSFKDSPARQAGGRAPEHVASGFRASVRHVLGSADRNPVARARVIHADSRTLDLGDGQRPEIVITSPPYPDRMSYIRELRPYMYWLGFLTEARAAGDLDWEAIGGTWGCATSRLTTWEPDADAFVPEKLRAALTQIRASGGGNAALLANYVQRYFSDMWRHVVSLRRVVADEGELHYVVGNVTFYGVVVPVEEVFAEMFTEAGFKAAEVVLLRKRNSNKHLFEYDVRAKF